MEFKIGQKVHWYNSYGVYIGIVTIVGLDNDPWWGRNRPDLLRTRYYVAPNSAHWSPIDIGPGGSIFVPVPENVYYPIERERLFPRNRKERQAPPHDGIE